MVKMLAFISIIISVLSGCTAQAQRYQLTLDQPVIKNKLQSMKKFKPSIQASFQDISDSASVKYRISDVENINHSRDDNLYPDDYEHTISESYSTIFWIFFIIILLAVAALSYGGYKMFFTNSSERKNKELRTLNWANLVSHRILNCIERCNYEDRHKRDSKGLYEANQQTVQAPDKTYQEGPSGDYSWESWGADGKKHKELHPQRRHE